MKIKESKPEEYFKIIGEGVNYGKKIRKTVSRDKILNVVND